MGLLVIDPGLSTTVQDAGRPGHREFGVPHGGAFDRGSADLANALVGNGPDCGVLEMTLSGGVYKAEGPLALALAGAPMEARIVGLDSTTQVIAPPLSFTLKDAERLLLGRTLEGARTYLAVTGGWQTRHILGSYSSEERIKVGQRLAAAPATIPTRRPGGSAWRSPLANPLRLIDGPDATSIPGIGPSFWSLRRFRVGSRSDRIGLRLVGEPLAPAASPERISAPVAPGAVQLAGGQLIVLGVACGTMGGYPHVAHVISADLDRLGQLSPGDTVHFCQVTIQEARDADQTARQTRRLLLSRIAIQAADAAD
jgi:biotin-dependent carboxylase-like uncharacterized protein